MSNSSEKENILNENRVRELTCENSDTDDYQTANSETETVSDKNKNLVFGKSYNCKLSKGKVEAQKENIATTKRVGKLTDQPKIRRTRKKRDSFIVSDHSSISDDDVTIYHRILSENIRTDVRKMTPKARPLRKSVSTSDERLFAHYIIGKRSGSESSSDYEEYEPSENQAKFELPRAKENRPPMLSSLKLKHGINELSDDDSASENEKRYSENERSGSLFLNHRSAPVAQNMRKFSWISSDDSSSDEKVPRTPQERLNKKKEKFNDERSEHGHYPSKKAAKATTLSFLKSLSNPDDSHLLHPDAEKYIKKFKKLKEELVSRLFKMFNEQVFKNQLPSDMKIEWNARLRKSAGLCYHERIKTVIGPNNECLRTSRISLSTKIIETPDRLRDTLIHEMCHAAAWIVNYERGHGYHWKSWASKAMQKFPELPLIERCHNYSIQTKYKYRCLRCGYTIGRHSKSLDLERKSCGYCHGRFELVGSSTDSNPLPKFASYVKENYSKIKSQNPDLLHKDVMKELSGKFASTKISN